MTKQEIIQLKDCTLFDKIMYDIQYLASHGSTSWTGFILEDTCNIVKRFKQLGFTISYSKLTCLLITISWNE